MNNKSKAVVVTPLYKETLSDNEVISFIQLVHVLKNWPLVFVCPENLDLTYYQQFLNDKDLNITFLRLPAVFFKDVEAYNRLMYQKSFYKKFINYEYMLIYQLDCLVFSDELSYWCDQGYSYIGAPWLRGNKFTGVAGNGGFSLRKVDDIIAAIECYLSKRNKILNLIYKINQIKLTPHASFYELLKKTIFLGLTWVYLKTSKMYEFRKKYKNTNEDIFFVRYVPMFYKQFNIAKPKVALRFSFEKSPRFLYKINKNKLPFGCHAWQVFDLEFWKEQCPSLFVKFSDNQNLTAEDSSIDTVSLYQVATEAVSTK